MLICVGGDIHGEIDLFYRSVLEFEGQLGVRIEHVLHVGDFGIWPDSTRVDKATRNHGGAGDFPAWLKENQRAPRPTTFIKGNHEDFNWLDARPTPAILPELNYLRNGDTVDIGDGCGRCIRVGGLGGCYGSSDFDRRSDSLQGYAKRHYTADEIKRLSGVGGVDIILTHDAPVGVRFPRHRRGSGYVSEAKGLDVLLEKAQPRVCFFGHHHARVDDEIAGVRCVGLNKVSMPGNLVAIDIEPGTPAWSIGWRI